MPKISTYPSGTFCWADLATTDAEKAKTFYTSLFGWSSSDMPMGEGMTYTMFKLHGVEVAAVGEQPDQPPHWNTYISVDNADESAAHAQSLGAELIAPAFDVMDSGRMAILKDPQGAYFFLWQPKNHKGSDIAGEPGTLCWTELATHDSTKAGEFYSKLFHWKPISNEVNGMVYTVFMKDDKMVAGMFSLGEDCKEFPPHWGIFFGVNNCKESLDKAVSLGAHVVVEPTAVENFGCFAVVRDPQGAHFGIVAMGEEKCCSDDKGGCC
ncbi:VOC family protein [Candidatus Dependentiae bacterium]|nr:VOC family protein [Candidatus Dependentiae bacterium]